MKKLIVVNGVPGAGKTTVCSMLLNSIKESAWLDGDWCWKLNPYNPSEENKVMVEKNICFMLKSYLENSGVNSVILSWVIPHDELMNRIIDSLYYDRDQLETLKITLTCSSNTLKERLAYEGRSTESIIDSQKRLKAYMQMDTIKIDTSKMSAEEVVDRVMEIINE